MSEFKIIETQEQLDAIIGERVKRAERKAEEKAMEKFGDLETKITSYEKQIADLSEQLKGNEGKLAESTTTIEDLTKKVHEYETSSVKTKIALETGLPYQLASKLSGDTEEAIREDAKKLAEYVAQPAAPLGSMEPDRSDENPKSAMFEMARRLGEEKQ